MSWNDLKYKIKAMGKRMEQREKRERLYQVEMLLLLMSKHHYMVKRRKGEWR